MICSVIKHCCLRWGGHKHRCNHSDFLKVCNTFAKQTHTPKVASKTVTSVLKFALRTVLKVIVRQRRHDFIGILLKNDPLESLPQEAPAYLANPDEYAAPSVAQKKPRDSAKRRKPYDLRYHKGTKRYIIRVPLPFYDPKMVKVDIQRPLRLIKITGSCDMSRDSVEIVDGFPTINAELVDITIAVPADAVMDGDIRTVSCQGGLVFSLKKDDAKAEYSSVNFDHYSGSVALLDEDRAMP